MKRWISGSMLVMVAFASAAGGALASVIFGVDRPAELHAANSDRYQEFVMATGAAALNPRGMSDALWMLDKKRNRLMATIIDRASAKVPAWAEMNLIEEFKLDPKADHHFMMTTGNVAAGQAALYLVETVSGKMGVYTLWPSAGPEMFTIRRHDLGSFRNESQVVPEKLN